MHTRSLSLRCSIWLLLASPSLAGDWTTLGGSSLRSGASGEIGPTNPTVRWESGGPSSFAPPAYVEGDVVVTTRMTDPGDRILGAHVVALALADGSTRWTAVVPALFADSTAVEVLGVRDGQVYVSRSRLGNLEYLYALDRSSGAILWRSQDLIATQFIGAVGFAENGDVIVEHYVPGRELMRIDKTHGATLWTASIPIARDSANTPAVNAAANRVYVRGVDFDGATEFVRAFDLSSGQGVYRSRSLGNGAGTQTTLFVAPDGTVYAIDSVSYGILAALTDTGTSLARKWTAHFGIAEFATFAVGPDGSVYSTVNYRITRHDPATGAVTNSFSPHISANGFLPRMATDAVGHVYLSLQSPTGDRLYCLSADLSLIWSRPMDGIVACGPAIAAQGVLVIAGSDGVFALHD